MKKIKKICLVFVALCSMIKVVQKFDTYLTQLTFKIAAIGGNSNGMSIMSLKKGIGNFNKHASNVA